MISFIWLFWDPNKEILTLPIVGFPIVWYSLFFAAGFLAGYYIFRILVLRYLSLSPHFTSQEILDSTSILQILSDSPTNENQKKIAIQYQTYQKKHKTDLLQFFNYLIDTPSLLQNLSATEGKTKQTPALRVRVFLEKTFGKEVSSISQKAAQLSDRLFFYMIISTIIGARLGHVFFYENWKNYLAHPLRILKTWEGGLASHGAAFAILIALALFAFSMRHFQPKITWLKLLDLIAPPVAFCGAMIRIGNFINQEILGTPSTLPWAVVFGHPADGSFSIPRHPVQLYEAFFYLLVFLLLFFLQKKEYFLLRSGKSIGLFLILIFGFRFFIEFIKEKQSLLISSASPLLMGQYLSIPFVLLGLFFFFYDRKNLKKQ